MQIATSMIGKHYKNCSKKLTIPMKETIAFSLYTDAPWLDEMTFFFFNQKNRTPQWLFQLQYEKIYAS